MKRPAAALATMAGLGLATVAAMVLTAGPTPRDCYEDEVRATFAAGPDGRTSTLCIHMDELSPAAVAQVHTAATAWTR